MKLIYFIILPFFTFSQAVVEEKKINIDSLLQTEEYQGIEIEKYTVKKGERMREGEPRRVKERKMMTWNVDP